MNYGVSYFGTFDPDHAAKDIEEISKHFQWIVFPLSEEIALYQQSNIIELVKIAQSYNLSTYAGTWGLLGIFGGEGLSMYGDQCISSCKSSRAMVDWLRVVKRAGFNGILWDEPEYTKLNNRGCVCNLTDFLNDYLLYARTEGIPRAMVYFREYEHLLNSVDKLDFRLISSVGTDAYQFTEIENKIPQFKEKLASLNVPFHLWIKGFGVNKNDIPGIIDSLNYAQYQKIIDIGIWGYKGSNGMGILKSDPDFWPTIIKNIEGGNNV